MTYTQFASLLDTSNPRRKRNAPDEGTLTDIAFFASVPLS